mgnify:CR=1 FL=1
MKKILLVCAAGMSTSMLVTKMKQAAEVKGIQVDISATSGHNVDQEVEGVNVMLLGPQVSFRKGDYEKKFGDKFPIDVINPMDYGMMNGEKVLEQALKLMGN